MPDTSSLYTFVFEYGGGTYVSQYRGRTHREAFARWLRTEPKTLEPLVRAKFAASLAAQFGRTPELVALDGIANTWCWTASLNKGLGLLNFIKTAS